MAPELLGGVKRLVGTEQSAVLNPTKMGDETLESLVRRPFLGFILGILRPSSPSWYLLPLLAM